MEDADGAWARFWSEDGDDRLAHLAGALESIRSGSLRHAVVHGNVFDTTIDADRRTVTVANVVADDAPLVLTLDAFEQIVRRRRGSP